MPAVMVQKNPRFILAVSPCWVGVGVSGCKGAGNGKVCVKAGGVRAKMSNYMQYLKTSTGYESLKTKYQRHLARAHPNLPGEPQLDNTQIGDMDRDLHDEEDDTEVTMGILPINPIVEKDKEIADLVKAVESLKDQLAIIPQLEKGLDEAKAENKRVLSISKQVGRRLSVSRKANEQKMVGLIRSGANWTEDSAHLACSHAATLDDDEFTLDDTTEEIKPKNKKWNFMKKVEEYLDKGDKMQEERLEEMKRMIMDQMKTTIKKKLDARGEKRVLADTSLDDTNAQSKARINSPTKQ